MSVNKYRPHLFVLPEDDANRQIANGFENFLCDASNLQILPVAGGWLRALEKFKEQHIPEMRANNNRHLVLLIDFDEQLDRLSRIRSEIPEDLSDRVFIFGTWDEPETFRWQEKRLSFEQTGEILAKECSSGAYDCWMCDMLSHNEDERVRIQWFIEQNINFI